jgi:hypothetical protein
MQANGSAAATRDYESYARSTIVQAFDPEQEAPPDGWVRPLVLVASAAVYALLEIARAIREQRA